MLKKYADLLLESMVAHDPWMLPLADRYAATENSIAGSLNMMSAWRTVTGVKQMGQCFVDEPAGQVFFTACLDEGGASTAFWARLKVEDEKLTELELYSSRSRADSGFVMLADDIGNVPDRLDLSHPRGRQGHPRGTARNWARPSSTARRPRRNPLPTACSWRSAGWSMRTRTTSTCCSPARSRRGSPTRTCRSRRGWARAARATPTRASSSSTRSRASWWPSA